VVVAGQERERERERLGDDDDDLLLLLRGGEGRRRRTQETGVCRMGCVDSKAISWSFVQERGGFI
jgi:hypothetical protein